MTRALLALVLLAPTVRADDPPSSVRVTVVVVLATTENNVVDPKLKSLAKEVQKHDKDLVGFRLAVSVWKSIPVGDTYSFDLVDKQKLKVKIDKPRGADGKIGLTVTPPNLGEITYECACSKFFPVITPYKTSKGEQLIVAVMAKPCTGNKR